MKTLPPRTKSKTQKGKGFFAFLQKTFSGTSKQRRFARSARKMDVSDILEENTKLEEKSKLPAPVFFPPND
jgi:hypothetical protein